VTFCNLIGLQWMLQSLDQYSVYTNARLDCRGSHLDTACRSIVTRIKYPDLALVAWLFPSEALDCLILQWFKGWKLCHTSLVAEKMCWWVDVSSWSLDQLVKGILIAWSHFDPSHKQQHVTTTFVIIRAAPMGMTLWHVKGSDAGLVARWACIVLWVVLFRTSACIGCNLSTTVLWSWVVSCSEPQHTGCAIDLPNGKMPQTTV